MNTPLQFGRIAFEDPFFRPFHKVNVGLDSMLDRLHQMTERHEEVSRFANASFPPVNILRNGSKYRIEMAIAGFKIEEIELTTEKDVLTVTGKQTERELAEGTEFMHQGIAARQFERKFILDEYVEVKSANMVDGMLFIDLEKNIPEEKLPKTIKIGTTTESWLKLPAKE